MTVYLQDHVSGDQDIAKLVHSMLEYTVLGDIVQMTEIYYDSDIRNTVVAKDVEFVKEYYEMSDETEAELSRLSPWVLRIELNQQICYDKKILMNEIVREIQAEYGSDLNVIVTDDNAEELVVRVRIVNDSSNGQRVDEEGNPIPFEEEEVQMGQEDDVFLKRLEKVGSKFSFFASCRYYLLVNSYPSLLQLSLLSTTLEHAKQPQAARGRRCEKSIHARWSQTYYLG